MGWQDWGDIREKRGTTKNGERRHGKDWQDGSAVVKDARIAAKKFRADQERAKQEKIDRDRIKEAKKREKKFRAEQALAKKAAKAAKKAGN